MALAADTAAALLADICQHPGDDTPRLIYADWLKEHDGWTWDTVQGHVLHHSRADGPRLLAAHWLDEHGEPERAEFIRVQCEMARIDEAWRDAGESQAPDCFVKVDRLRRRERELLEGQILPLHTFPSARSYDCWPRVLYRRGFVEEITLTTEDFLLHAHALFRAAPLVRVTLSDREPWFSWLGHARYWKRQDSDDEQICRWALPSCLYDLIAVKELSSPRYAHGGVWKRFENEIAALSALRAAALLWGRRQGWPCPACGGNGRQGGIQTSDCPVCHGTGHTVEEG
jgi:uncharacterized protein (TIGR02996 family)